MKTRDNNDGLPDISPELIVNTDLLRRILVDFIAAEVRKVGFERVLLGLSGGIDSSLAAFLAAEALGPDSVVGVMMPYRASDPRSMADAAEVVKKTGIQSLQIDITPMIDAYFEMEPDADDNRRGNKMARERMAVLYDCSAKFNGLVIGTSNKTELLLGYGTQYGDLASAINPLGDIYKTHVRQLALAAGVPKSIIGKEPSADLWAGQTDEGELGFTYEMVDRLLYRMVDLRYSDERLVQDGFEVEFIERVRQKIRNSQFKRRLPLIAKVSTRTIDRDFRYPRDWGF
jgi:NAD+ synthase